MPVEAERRFIRLWRIPLPVPRGMRGNPVKKFPLLGELPPKKNDRPRESSRLWYKSNRQDLQNIVSKKKYFKPISRLNRETSSQIEFG